MINQQNWLSPMPERNQIYKFLSKKKTRRASKVIDMKIKKVVMLVIRRL